MTEQNTKRKDEISLCNKCHCMTKTIYEDNGDGWCGKCQSFKEDYNIHKPDKKKSKPVLSSDSSTSYLGEKLVAELRSKNPYNPKKEPYCDMSWNTCCDELEKMLKEERK